MAKNQMFNGSGCKDPTAYSAIKKVDQEKRLEKQKSENEIKDLLEQYSYACDNIRVMKEEIKALGEAIKSERDTSKAIQIREDSVQVSNRISDPTAEAVTRIIDKYEKQVSYMSERIDQLYIVKNRVDEILSSMNEQQREVLTLLLIKQYKWHQACNKLHISKSSLYRIRDEGIKRGFECIKKTKKKGEW